MNTFLVPGSVLVGADGSPCSDTAVQWAATYARAHSRPPAVVHGAGAAVGTELGIDLEEARQALMAAGQRVIEHALELVEATSPSVAVSVHLELREPRELLIDKAADASLLVLGSRGRGTVASLLLGSVSVALASHAPCPVVVAREDPDGGAPQDRPVVVGADGTADSGDALTFGFELASEQNRPLEVVHAVGDAWVFPAPGLISPEMVEEVLTDWKLLLAESLAGYAEKFPDVDVRSHLVKGSPTQALVTASERASTVVVGARQLGAVRKRLLGSVSRSVVEHAHCTVAVVRGAEA